MGGRLVSLLFSHKDYMKHNFTEDDKKKVIEFLNCVAKNAKFDLSVPEIIEFFKLLSFMQQSLIPKIDANILEIIRVVEASKNAEAVKESN